jgi:hypothetical protein
MDIGNKAEEMRIRIENYKRTRRMAVGPIRKWCDQGCRARAAPSDERSASTTRRIASALILVVCGPVDLSIFGNCPATKLTQHTGQRAADETAVPIGVRFYSLGPKNFILET